jgi:hypothetical protein
MAKFASCNNAEITGTANNFGHVRLMYTLKTIKKQAGWTIPYSSDGTTFNASGDQITHAGTGAGGLMNNRAWFVAREPGGRREWCWQAGNTVSASQARVKYSAAARFALGAPTAQVTPSAADERVLIGGGTDAVPTMSQIVSDGPAYRYHIAAHSMPVSGAYYFGYFVTTVPGASQGYGVCFQEPMAPGSFVEGGDNDPVAIACKYDTQVAQAWACWYGYGTPSQVWVVIGGTLIWTSHAVFAGNMGTDLVTGQDVNGKMHFYANVSSAPRFKGIGAFIGRVGPARNYPATLNTATDAYVYLGNYLYPFADNVVPSVA